MEENSIQTEIETFIIWLNSFPNLTKKCRFMTITELQDGIELLEVLNQMDGVIWPRELISYDECTFSKSNFMLINQGINKFYKKMGCQQLDCFTRKDFISPDPMKYSQNQEMLKILQLVLGVAVQCDNKEYLINDILANLDENTQSELMKIIQLVLQKYAPHSLNDQGSFQNIQEVSNNSDNSQSTLTELQQAVEKLEQQNKKYMKTISDIEQENATLKAQYQNSLKEIESVKQQLVKQNDAQKYMNLQQTLQDLQIEHGDIGAKLKKVGELESTIEMKDRKIFEYEKMFDRLKKDFESQKNHLQEELEIEKEKNLQLQKVERQMHVYKKKSVDYSQQQNMLEQRDLKIKELDEYINSLQQEINSKKQSEETAKFLREELNKEKLRISQVEISLQDKDHIINDLQQELKLWKKKDDLNTEKINELELELDEIRQTQCASLNESHDNLQLTFQQDLEAKIQQMQQENDILKMNQTSLMNQKLLELEHSLNEEQRSRASLEQQMVTLTSRCKKLESENESLKLDLETQKYQDGPKSTEMKQLKDEKQKALEKLKIANQKLQSMDSIQKELLQLQKLKEDQMAEIKTIYTEKNNLINEMLRLKDEINQLKNTLQEQSMKEQFFEKEKQLLESQIQQLVIEKQQKATEQEANTNNISEKDANSLKLKLQNKDYELKEQERILNQQLDDLSREHQKELKELEYHFEQETIGMKNLISELNEEVKNERKIRFEIEKANAKQEELTASLIMNLSMEFMSWKKDIPAEKEQPQKQDPANAFLQKKRQNTYKTFNNLAQ